METARTAAASAMSEVDAFSLVAAELAQGQKHEGLWLKSLSDSDGDEAKAKIIYSRSRAATLLKNADENAVPATSALLGNQASQSAEESTTAAIKPVAWFGVAVIATVAILVLGLAFWLRTHSSSWANETITRKENSITTSAYQNLAIHELISLGERGDADAATELSSRYHSGKNVPRDYDQSFKWELKAAQLGNADAMFGVGTIYFHGSLGQTRNPAEAEKWWRMALAHSSEVSDLSKNHATYLVRGAQYKLGALYYGGDGVPKDYAEALKWFCLAAEANDRAAQTALGNIYLHGEGVTKDTVKAAHWFFKAAEQGDPLAQGSLGVLFDKGLGVPTDQAVSVKWFRISAEGGNAVSQWLLANAMDFGRGTAKDYIEAYKWYNLAVAGGYSEAKAGLNKLETKMTPEQIAEGQRLAREYKHFGEWTDSDVEGWHAKAEQLSRECKPESEKKR